jgi:hypothetical protein
MRKTLSFVLVLALVLGSFSMATADVAYANTGFVTLSDVAGLLGEEQIAVSANLGIIEGFPDGTFRPDELVNRAQFAAIVTRAMGIPDSALAGFATTTFQDTAGFGWAVPYLAFAHSRGIMLGDGHGNAMPGRTITVNEAVTMIARALGYIEISEELVGNWPANYITLGQRLGLYENITTADVNMTREMAAIAMYNGLTVQMVSVEANGRTWPLNFPIGHRWENLPQFLLNTGLDAIYVQNAILGTAAAPIANSFINVTDRIGAFGEAFLNRDGDLIAFRKDPGTALLTGTISGNVFVSGGMNYSIGEQNIDRFFSVAGVNNNIASNVVYIMNGEPVVVLPGSGFNVTSSAAITAWANDGAGTGNTASWLARVGGRNGLDDRFTDGREITISANVSGSTIRDIFAVVGWTANRSVVASSVDLTAMNNDRLLGFDFPLDFDRDIAVREFSLVGVDSLSDIEAGHVVYLYHDGENVIRKIAVGTEVVEGSITERNDNSFVVDGSRHFYARNFLPHAINTADRDIFDPADLEEVGIEVTARLDAFGNAYTVDLDGGGAGMFGLVRAVQDDPTVVAGQQIRMINTDEASVVHGFAGTATLRNMDGSTFPGRRPQQELGTGRLLEDPGNLIAYRLNSAGNINQVQLAYDSSASPSAIFTINNRNTMTTADPIRGERQHPIAPNVVIFFNANPGDPEEVTEVYTIGDIDFTHAGTTPVSNGQFILNAAGRVVAILVTDPDFFDGADGLFGVINNQHFEAAFDRLDVILIGDDRSMLQANTDDVNLQRNVPGFYEFTVGANGRVSDINNRMTALGGGSGNNFAARTSGAFFALDLERPDNMNPVNIGGGVLLTTDTAIALGNNVFFTNDVTVIRMTRTGANWGYVTSNLSDLHAEVSSAINDPGRTTGAVNVWGIDTRSSSNWDGSANVIIWTTVGFDAADGTPQLPRIPNI